MKKELAAAIILAALLAGTLINIRVVDDLTEGILALVDESESAVVSGDMPLAVAKAEKAAEMWQNADAYTHIFLRHSEIDGATNAFYELLIQLESGQAGGAMGAFESLRAHLTSISGMEHVTLGSVL